MSRRKRAENGSKMRLCKNELFCLRRIPRGMQILCLSVRLWVILEGDREDHLLQAGDSFLPRVSRRRPIIYSAESSELVLLKGGISIAGPGEPRVPFFSLRRPGG